MFFAILAPGNKRNKIMKSLFNANISSRITFPPTHLNRWHRKLFQASRLKNTEELGKRILSIPLGNCTLIVLADSDRNSSFFIAIKTN